MASPAICVTSYRTRNAGNSTVNYNHPGTLGVDIDPEGAAVLNKQGYHVIVADVETMDLGKQFDTIVAGEIIEHLENPGLFLRNMHKHLKPGGVIIVSTPNPFYAGSAWKIWRYGRPAVHEEHMGWQDPTTLSQLLKQLEACWTTGASFDDTLGTMSTLQSQGQQLIHQQKIRPEFLWVA